MSTAPIHRCRVIAAPWAGVHVTDTESACRFGRHWHGTYGLGLLVDGAQQSASGRGPVEAHAGDLITSNPGEVHDGRPIGPGPRRWHMVYLDPAAMNAFAGSADAADLRCTAPVFRDRPLRAALQRFFRAIASGAPTLAAEEALVAACGLLRAGHTTAAPGVVPSLPMHAVRDHLAADLLSPPSLEDLAAEAGLSRFQVLRRFEQVYGVPPHAWLMQHRAEHARHLIRQGATLADAAAASGFADQSHMTRLFLRHFGFTPGAWRLAALAAA